MNNEGASQLAESLKLTSKDLKQLGVIDSIVPEPLGGASRSPHAAHNLEQYVAKTLRDLKRAKVENLLGGGTRNSAIWARSSKPRARWR